MPASLLDFGFKENSLINSSPLKTAPLNMQVVLPVEEETGCAPFSRSPVIASLLTANP